MKISQLHPWDVTYHEAIEIQKRLQSFLELRKLPRKIRYVAGVDVSFSKRSDNVWAGIVVLSYPRLLKIEERWIKGETGFPYIPGLLSFRELPTLLGAIQGIENEPDLIFCDGQGIAHPRRLGIAAHLGILINKPTIGCAKSRLVGTFSNVGKEKGSYEPLWYKGCLVGSVVRTRQGVKPVFISPGNRITLDESVKMVLNCCSQYRIPEPVRQAHLLVNRLKRKEEDV